MSDISDYLEQKLLDHVFGGAAYTQPTNTYAALFTAAPSDAGGGTECSGTGYARQAISWNAAASPGGTKDNSAQIDFGTDTLGDWGTLTHVGIFDAAVAGNLLMHGALTVSKTPQAGDPVNFPVGDLVLTLA